MKSLKIAIAALFMLALTTVFATSSSAQTYYNWSGGAYNPAIDFNVSGINATNPTELTDALNWTNVGSNATVYNAAGGTTVKIAAIRVVLNSGTLVDQEVYDALRPEHIALAFGHNDTRTGISLPSGNITFTVVLQ